jgi:tetratricopeptide (TPR) repeat protein
MNKTLFAVLIFVSTSITHGTCAYNPREKVAGIVGQIQRADYEGDQAAMQRGFDDLALFVEQKEIASRVRYWRGFALWRRAINGFNDAVDPKELEKDLNAALDEFKIALERDPKFLDAKLGIMSCNGFLLFVEPRDEARRKERIDRILALEKEATAMTPENPRLIWVRGPILWNSPPERGGGQDKTMQNFEHGLEICSKLKPSDDPIEPSWGKPELMMSLAYCHLNTKANPDLDAAERYAREALEIVPYWHYTRDILLPQILTAKEKAK